jgi:hypothetical protein
MKHRSEASRENSHGLHKPGKGGKMRGEMRYPARAKHLGWIFGLVVLVPGVLLAVIAVRSINREEAYIEKQLESGVAGGDGARSD